MAAIEQFAQLISTAPREHDRLALGGFGLGGLSDAARRSKFDQCLEPFKTAVQRDDLWALLNCLEQQDNLVVRLEL